jgi:hypothetical protein
MKMAIDMLTWNYKREILNITFCTGTIEGNLDDLLTILNRFLSFDHGYIDK